MNHLNHDGFTVFILPRDSPSVQIGFACFLYGAGFYWFFGGMCADIPVAAILICAHPFDFDDLFQEAAPTTSGADRSHRRAPGHHQGRHMSCFRAAFRVMWLVGYPPQRSAGSFRPKRAVRSMPVAFRHNECVKGHGSGHPFPAKESEKDRKPDAPRLEPDKHTGNCHRTRKHTLHAAPTEPRTAPAKSDSP